MQGSGQPLTEAQQHPESFPPHVCLATCFFIYFTIFQGSGKFRLCGVCATVKWSTSSRLTHTTPGQTS